MNFKGTLSLCIICELNKNLKIMMRDSSTSKSDKTKLFLERLLSIIYSTCSFK